MARKKKEAMTTWLLCKLILVSHLPFYQIRPAEAAEIQKYPNVTDIKSDTESNCNDRIAKIEAKGNEPSYLKGKGFDKNGTVTYEIEGSWLSEVRMKNVETGQTRVVWEDDPPGPDAHLQYFF